MANLSFEVIKKKMDYKRRPVGKRNLYISLCSIFFIVWMSLDAVGQSYMGTANETIDLRQTPGSNAKIKATIPKGSLIYVDAVGDYNGYYYCIVTKTNKDGYIPKNSISFKEKVAMNRQGLFSSDEGGNTENPEIHVNNASDISISLKLNQKTYYINAQSDLKITLKPGKYKYIASAENTIPDYGEENLKRGAVYTWNFMMVRESTKKTVIYR